MNRYIRFYKIKNHCYALNNSISIRLLSYNNNKSTNNDDSNGRLRVLLKKFLLHVHPDFFQAHKQEQLCNETNIKTLLALDVFNNNNDSSMPFRSDQTMTNTRTLIFYIKASSVTEKPRRIKISIHRVEESIREVLETLGITDLPPRLESSSSSSSYISSNPIEVSAFLDTLIDRKELMIWRQQRMINFLKMNDTLKEVLGVTHIDMRLSWSAQNNAYLMASLLRLIESERNSMFLPWTGLSLIFTADDCTSHPINYIEGEVQINPTQVPAQWVSILRGVDNDIINKSAAFKSEMMMMKESAELLATDQLRQTMLEVLNNSKQASDSDINNDELRMILEGLTVSIKRGNTIDNKWFHHFLKSLLQVKRRNPLDDLITSEEEDADSISTINNKENSLMVNPVHKIWLQQLPLNIELVIEHGRGTKLLKTGQLRVDARVDELTFFDFIRDKGLASISLIAEQKRRETMINDMKEEIKSTIGVQSIEAGIGISSPTMETCLVRLTDYINKTKGGKLRSLAGFNVRIGKYIGFTDDGCCIIPENWDLQ